MVEVTRRTALHLVALVTAAQAVRCLILRWRHKKKYDDLDGLISFSSRIIAASRSLESEQEHAMFNDPLARALAGPAAIALLEKRELAKGSLLPVEVQKATGRRWRIGRIVARTLWFDRQLLDGLRHESHPQPLQVGLDAAGGGSGVQLNLQPNATPQQVISLGAGMCTRAWRLNLPEGVKWFEVDRSDVLGAKWKVLTAAGATFEAEQADDVRQQEYPLRAASYTGVEADLRFGSWTEALTARGFDRTKPTVWLSEGLVMYFHEHEARQMYREMAGVSAPGSVFLNMQITATCLRFLKTLPKDGRLENEMLSGCPDDPRQAMEEDGWRVRSISTHRSIIAEVLPDTVPQSVFPQLGSLREDGMLLYIAATPAPGAAQQQ